MQTRTVSHIAKAVIAYEAGELSGWERIQLFADLISTGLIQTMANPHYQREAAELISAGYINADGQVIKYTDLTLAA